MFFPFCFAQWDVKQAISFRRSIGQTLEWRPVRLFDDILVPTISKKMLFESSSIPSTKTTAPTIVHISLDPFSLEDVCVSFWGAWMMNLEMLRLLSTNLKNQTTKL